MHKLITPLFIAGALACAAVAQDQWSQFRGPHGRGIAAGEQALPVKFDAEHNLIWKCAVSAGHSSPCQCDDRIFLTGYTGK